MINQWKNYWNNYGSPNPVSKLMNVWVLVTLLLVLVIGLTGYSLKTGDYTKTLETNVTSLSSNFDKCLLDYKQTTMDLDTCNFNLQNKVGTLGLCQTQTNALNTNLNTCKSDLSSCTSKKNELQNSLNNANYNYNQCTDDLDSMTSSRNNIQSSYNSLQTNFNNLQSGYNQLRDNFVKDYCCVSFKNTTTSKTYYTMNGNDVSCSLTTGTEFSC